MNSTCIVVADTKIARFYGVEAVDSPRVSLKLVEQSSLSSSSSDLRALGESVSGRPHTETNSNRGSGPMHPMSAQRDRHRVELERRFGQEIASQAAQVTRGWKTGTVVLVAEPRLLGLVREPLRKALHQGIELKELAKDYVQLTASELRDHLVLASLVPARRGVPQ